LFVISHYFDDDWRLESEPDARIARLYLDRKNLMRKNVIHVQKWPHPHQPQEAALRQELEAEGLEPFLWENEPLAVYEAATFDHDRVLYVLRGTIIFGFPIESEPTVLRAGDRLNIPAGVAHNAAVGAEGIACLEAHR
jgi:quercetin dioxygenase-like cupin family protein